MREIKFRGKRIDNGEWVEGSLFVANWINEYGFEEKEYFIQTFPSSYSSFSLTTEAYKVIPETVGQSTGLKDKNGKEVYEGDVLKSIALSDDHHQRGAIIVSPVKYWCGNACLSITYVPIYPFCVNHELEVIGNIYDNPDLLAANKSSE